MAGRWTCRCRRVTDTITSRRPASTEICATPGSARVQVACRLLAQLGDNLECAKMKKTLIGLGAAVALLAIPAAASAYPARVSATVNLRTCGSTACPIVTVLPAGALVDVRATSGGWDYLTYGRFVG